MPKLIYHDSDGMDKVVMLGAEPVLIGRATECQVQTQDAMVSRRHARIYWDGNYWIEDLGSSNGVYVGNDKVQKAPFRPGDTVTCGSLVLRLMPDTSPRMTGNMAPVTTPPIGSPVAPPPSVRPATLAPPPPAPPPPAATPPPATLPPPSRGDVQIGPNAVLRGAGASPHATTGAQASFAEELRSERQRREQAEARAAELEAVAREAGLLQRKLDQAQADLRRLRGGQPVDDARDSAELRELRARVVELEAQRAAPAPSPTADEARLKRQLEQLQAELRRARGSGEPAAPARPSPSVDPAAADAAIALGDSLAELRASLRAANDEAGLLTAPSASVEIVGEALRAAAEQLEAARAHLRALGKLLGVG